MIDRPISSNNGVRFYSLAKPGNIVPKTIISCYVFGAVKLAVSKQIVLPSLWLIFYFDIAVYGSPLQENFLMSSTGTYSALFLLWLNWEKYVSDAKFVSGKQKYF